MNLLTWLPAYRRLAQENERLQRDNVLLRDAMSKANLSTSRYNEEASRQRNIIDMLREELQTANKDVERYVNENTALKDQAAKQPAPIPARPGAKKKAVEQ